MIKQIVKSLVGTFFGTQSKNYYELAYWKAKKELENRLKNDHYVWFYTDHFHLSKEFYAGKNILDIGCGPRGSLEWATMAKERIGLDPLAESYLSLGASEHKMRYVTAKSENIPFQNNYFDVVCSFNSLDHVDNLDKTVAEIIRVIKKEGMFLLLTDVNHEPMVCEPVSYSFDIVKKFFPQMELVEELHFEKKSDGLYQSLKENILFDETDTTKRYGILSAKFMKVM